MTTTAAEMQQAMLDKDSTLVELTEIESQRMIAEIESQLLQIKTATACKETSLVYRLRSFIRDAPNIGKLWTQDGRDSRVESSLTGRGFFVQYSACNSDSCPANSEFYQISWGTN